MAKEKPFHRNEELPVIDAKRPLVLNITKDDIAKASAKDPYMCAAALALKRHNFMEAHVHLSRVYIRTNKGNWQRYITPKPLRDELIAFDRGGTFEAGDYTLQAPLPSQKLTYKKPTGPKRKKGKARKSPHIVKNVRPVA